MDNKRTTKKDLNEHIRIDLVEEPPKDMKIPVTFLVPNQESSKTIGEKAFDIFYSHLGQKETGHNNGPVVEWAMAPFSKVKPDETGWAEWCAAAVCTSYLEAGSEMIKKVASTNANTLYERIRKFYPKNITCFIDEKYPPQKGDLIFFAQNGKMYHVGMVNAYQPDTHQVITIEGNHNNRVEIVTRSSWYAFARIDS